MNLLKAISSNFSKIGYVISHISNNKNHQLKLGLMSQFWSTLFNQDKTKRNSMLQPMLRLNHYQIFTTGKKLILKKKVLLEQNFSLKKFDDLSNLQLLLITLDHNLLVNTNISESSSPLKLENYFDVIARKGDMCFLAGYSEKEQFLSFCSELFQRNYCNIFMNKFVSSITNFDLDEVVSVKNESIIKELQAVESSKKALNKKTLLNRLQNQIILNPTATSLSLKSNSMSSRDETHTSADNVLGASVSKRINLLTHSGKPPNVLVYTGSDEIDSKKFEDVRSILLQCLARDRYAIYHLRNEQVTTVPWLENTILLVLVAKKIQKDGLCETFLTYFLNGGTVLSMSSNFDESFMKLTNSQRQSEIIKISYKDFNNISVFGCSSCYDYETSREEDSISLENIASNSENGGHVIALARHKQSSGVALLSLVSFERDASDKMLSDNQFVALKMSNPSRINVFRSLLSSVGLNCCQSDLPPLSPLILFGTSQDSVDSFYSAIKDETKEGVYLQGDISYEFLSKKLQDNLTQTPTETYLPVIEYGANESFQCGFDFEAYKNNLKTSVFGNVVIFGDVVTTTMKIVEDYMDHMPPEIGLVAIASSQLAGIGRGGNVWLSPKGCALFSLHVGISLGSPLGNCISCFQQLIALASVLAVRKKKGYENIDLRIKWPNDVYYGDKLKLGGVLIKSSVLGNMVHINLGCGVNISNKDPTTCLNDIILQHNNSCSSPDSHLQPFTVEEFVARLITQIEHLISQFQEDFGDSFYDLYHLYWLHSNQEVTLYKSDGPKGKILGITQEGFLLVRLEDGHIVEVHPDGNSFDMMKNLIISKLQN